MSFALSSNGSSSFLSQSSFSSHSLLSQASGRSISDASPGSINSISNFTIFPEHNSSQNYSSSSSSNFTRNLEKNLSRITSGFSKSFAHSFSMNERRSSRHHKEVHTGVQNMNQHIMNDGTRTKFSKIHKIPFPRGFSSRIRGPIATRMDQRGRRSTTIRPQLTISSKTNSTLPHLPVLWTALSLALGVEVRGELIRGLPCITRFNQLFCRSGGNSYPSDRIESFIDDNKALIRRMYGEFISLSVLTDNLRSGRRKRRSIEDWPIPDEEYFDIPKHHAYMKEVNQPSSVNHHTNSTRFKRQTSRTRSPGPLPRSKRVDSCQSDEEVATPYWASNSRGKILAIVNTNAFSQIIHQEICTKQTTKRCNNDCGCEQKYKYHRLMAYDPKNDCQGIFMDWFLFPSCCSCRCDPL